MKVSMIVAVLPFFLTFHCTYAGRVRGSNDAESKDHSPNVRALKKQNSDELFPPSLTYNDWAICKGKITKRLFPHLNAPTNEGGCVRYFRGVDITGVVTEIHFFVSDGVKSACDCIAKCLQRPESCTNWVYKHTFMTGDGGQRSCTLYSSPNLPSNVTLAYDLANSAGFEPLDQDNNPQAGAPAPLTFSDAANKIQDNLGVSGFIVQDQKNNQYC